MRNLPLFPLNTVLFPGATLPLRIFEQRYKAMLNRCMEDDRRFGVVLIKSGEEVGSSADPFEVGTVARIVSVGSDEKGVIPIETVGEQRFRINLVDRSNPYLVGEVTMMEDDVDASAGRVSKSARRLAEAHLRLLLAVQGEWRGEFALPDEPVQLSYFLGTLLLSQPTRVRQALLEADPVSRRLRVGSMAIEEATRELEVGLMRAGPGRSRSVFGLN